MLASIFQNSKSALAFAASVIVCALMLIGPKDNGGLLDRAVTGSKEERATIASNAAMMSEQMGTPQVGDYKPQASGLEEPGAGFAEAAGTPSGPSRVIRLDPVTMQPIGEVATPPLSDPSIEDSQPAQAYAAPEPAAPPREAVVTSRMIRIEPQ